MPDGEEPLHETDEEDRKRRQQALRSLAQNDASRDTTDASTVTPSDATSTFALSSRRRPWWTGALILALCTVALASLGYFAIFRPTGARPTATPTPVVASIRENNLTCMKAMAVSPDGASVAILGYQRDCPSANPQGYAYHPGQVNIYSTKTSNHIASIQPDDIIAKALHPQTPPDVQPASRKADTSHAVIRYDEIFWSPDNTQLAISFALSVYSDVTPQAGAQTSTVYGVLLTDVHGTHTRVLAQTLGPFTVYTGAWNITTGAYIPIPAGVDQGQWTPVPPALSYTWDSTDTLVAQGQKLSHTTVPPTPEVGPLGDPIGGQSFTTWQPAQIQPIVDTTTDIPSAIPNAYIFGADFPAWSPDSTRLFLNVNMNISEVLTAQGNGADNLGRSAVQMSLLPMRDKGLAAAIADLKPTVNPAGSPQVMDAAWRFDGRVVAASILTSSTRDRASAGPAQVRLYDCASGRLLGTLQGQPLSNTQQAGALYLRWTPDGSHLLLLDTGNGKLTIWGPGQLPK
ncbi:MAG TPA: hypothetical protein VFU63_03650 [Ktedonobacterales bacterium]|nr:hypothetical protein [Ktedonobacterales bacterium]